MSYPLEIKKLDKCLDIYCHYMYSRLLPPLPEPVIDSFLREWGIFDKSLLDIFTWKNGIPYDASLPTLSFDFTGFGVIPPLEYIEKIKKLGVENWRKSLFPLVVSYAGDFILYETDKESDSYGRLFLYSPNLGFVDDLIGYFDNIETMVDTIVSCFEKKIFTYDDQKYSLAIDYEKQSKISQEINPKSEYWQ